MDRNKNVADSAITHIFFRIFAARGGAPTTVS